MNLEKVFKDKTTYVICSTLNQIVNYIPIKIMESRFKCKEKNKRIEIFNITVRENSEQDSIFKRFDNGAWDKNLNNVLKQDGIHFIESNYISIKRNDYDDISKKIKKKVLGQTEDGTSELNVLPKADSEGKRIVWNITGGQRSTVFAIQKFIIENKRKQDCIIYLEGNSNNIVCLPLMENKEFKYELLEDKYWDSNNFKLDLNTVFQLAGFEINNDKEMINYLKPLEIYKKNDKLKEYNLCKRFYKYYKDINSEIGKYFRNNFSLLNKNIDKKSIGDFWDGLKKNDKNNEFSNDDRLILEDLKGESQKKFGYILEYMTLASMVDTIKSNPKLLNYTVGIYHSIRLNRSEEFFKERDTAQLCEFDVVLLTKSGQVVIFECKSGAIESDVGKARQYTAYAAAGVYGKPILITPLLKNDRKFINENVFGKKQKERNQEEINKLGKYDDDVLQAVRAAARANIEIWGLDEIGEKLLKLYNEVLKLGGES